MVGATDDGHQTKGPHCMVGKLITGKGRRGCSLWSSIMDVASDTTPPVDGSEADHATLVQPNKDSV